jgi:Zn-dependent M32 family carboxypeptidase
MVYPASELCSRVSGADLNPDFFTGYLEEKYGGIYGLRGN